MNDVKLEGHLTKDAKLNERGDTVICDMRLAVNGSGKSRPMFIDVAAFNEAAAACLGLTKGARLRIERGALRYSEWESKDGSGKRSKHSVIAYEVAVPASN